MNDMIIILCLIFLIIIFFNPNEDNGEYDKKDLSHSKKNKDGDDWIRVYFIYTFEIMEKSNLVSFENLVTLLEQEKRFREEFEGISEIPYTLFVDWLTKDKKNKK